MNDLNKAQVLADSAHLLAEKINRARFEGKKISDEQTVKLCEMLSVLAELLGEAAQAAQGDRNDSKSKH